MMSLSDTSEQSQKPLTRSRPTVHPGIKWNAGARGIRRGRYWVLLTAWCGLRFHSVHVRGVTKCVPVILAACAKTLETLRIELIFIMVCGPVIVRASTVAHYLQGGATRPSSGTTVCQKSTFFGLSKSKPQSSIWSQQALLLPSNRSSVQSHPEPFSSNLGLSSGSARVHGQTNGQRASSIIWIGCIV